MLNFGKKGLQKWYQNAKFITNLFELIANVQYNTYIEMKSIYSDVRIVFENVWKNFVGGP